MSIKAISTICQPHNVATQMQHHWSQPSDPNHFLTDRFMQTAAILTIAKLSHSNEHAPFRRLMQKHCRGSSLAY